MRFGKKEEKDERKGLNGWEPHQDSPTCPRVPYIVCGSLRGLNRNPQKIVNWNFQIVHGPLCGLEKTIKSRPDSYALPDVSYAWDLQAQGACPLRFFIFPMTTEKKFSNYETDSFYFETNFVDGSFHKMNSIRFFAVWKNESFLCIDKLR